MVTSLTASARGHWLVSTYAVVHGVGEFLTALTLFSLFTIGHATGGEIVIYSVLAFGCPSLIALLAYGRRLGKQTEGRIGLTGTVLMAAGILAAPLSWAAVVLLGVGSATFHIAAGTATLKMPNRGTAVGVFESTGAVGLALGGVLGADVWHTMAVSYWSYVAAAVLIVGGLVVLIWGTAHELPGLSAELPADNNVHAPQPSQKPSFTGLVGWMTGNNAVLPTTKSWTLPAGVGRAPFVALSALTIISITRAVTGFAAPQPWKDTTTMVLVASILVAVGRAVGGVAADRYGFALPAVFAFTVAAVFLGAGTAWAGLIGVCFLAGTMAPVILALVAITGRPSFAFGLAQLFQVPAAFTAGFIFLPGVTAVVMVCCVILIFVIRPLDSRRIYVAA